MIESFSFTNFIHHINSQKDIVKAKVLLPPDNTPFLVTPEQKPDIFFHSLDRNIRECYGLYWNFRQINVQF